MKALVLAAGLALLAQAVSSGTTRADAVSSTVVPTLVISGTTEGSGTLQLGIDYRIPLAEAGNGATTSLRVEPVFEASSSDGVSELFRGDSEGSRGPSSWTFGMTATYVEGQALTGRGKLDELNESDKLRLAERCLREDPDFAGRLDTARRDEANRRSSQWRKGQAVEIEEAQGVLADAERRLIDARAQTQAIETRAEAAKIKAEAAAAVAAFSKKAADSAVQNGATAPTIAAAQARQLRDEGAARQAALAASSLQEELSDARSAETSAAVAVTIAQASWDDARRAQWPMTAEQETDIWTSVVSGIGADKFCPSAIGEFKAAEEKEARPSPARQLSFAFRMGRSEQTYLKLGEPAEGSDTNVYTKTSKKNPRLSAGVSYTKLDASNHFTLEVPARFDLEYPSSGKKARWCTPAGAVTRPGGAAGEVDMAESCDEQALGEPVRSFTAKAGAYVGYVAPDESWRIAAGFVSKVEMVDGDNPYEIGIEAPFYFFNTSPNYAGLVRVTPSALITRDLDGKEDAKILVTLSLLGKRTLFTGALQ
jgi:hypothetical protein